MITADYPSLVKLLAEAAKLPVQDIEEKVQAKLRQLSGLISKEGAAHIIANELGVKFTPVADKISSVKPTSRDIELIAKVAQVYPVSNFTRKDGQSGKVASLVVADETGSIRLTCWGNMADQAAKAKPNDVIKIIGGYARDNQGRLEIHLNERANLVVNPSGLSVKIPDVIAGAAPINRPKAQRKYLNEIQGTEEAVEVLGTIVQVFEPRFFEVCPVCQKRLKGFEGSFMCPEHAKQQPQYSTVLNVVLDDGSDNMRTVFFRRQAERLLKNTDLEAIRLAPEKFNQLKVDLLGQIIKVEGKPKNNEMFGRKELVVNVVDTNPDPKAELARLEQKNE